MNGAPAARGRVAVIGDVGGHLGPLRAELARLGAQLGDGPLDVVLPPDLTVVQVGDLVHRGPDSAGVVALVDHLTATSPGRWWQLVGNHEAQYLREPAFHWPERLDEASALTLFDLWSEGRMQVAAVVTTAGGRPWLVTHAGLTAGFWREALDAPPRAELAARALNGLRHDHADVVFHAGSVLGGGPPDPTAGPLWAAAGPELVAGWLAEPEAAPFDQVHGHSAMAGRGGRLTHAPAGVAQVTTRDALRAHETSVVHGATIVGVDPRHGARPTRRWEAFVLDDAVVSWGWDGSDW